MHKTNEPWTAHVVSRMHRYGIKNYELASICNYTEGYISEVLHGRKKFKSEESYNRTKNWIVGSLENYIETIIAKEGLE